MSRLFPPEFVNRLRAAGGRLTLLRQKILEVLAKKTLPLTAQEILRAVKTKEQTVNKTSVYRQLDWLLKNNFVENTRLGGRAEHFELATSSARHHHHAVCLACGRVEDIAVPSQHAARFSSTLAQKKKFKVLRHSLEFYGWCAACAKKR